MSGRHILLIEDEPNIAEAVRYILSHDGWSVFIHGDGKTALAVLRERTPDVAVLDVMLPGRSGYDILADLRADPELSDTPVLMLTARGAKNERALAERLGADIFMTKPFSNDALVAAVRKLADGVPDGDRDAGAA